MKWLEELKTGDHLFVVSRGFASGAMLAATVFKLTASQIMLANGDRFSKKTGEQIGCGDRFYRKYLEERNEANTLKYKNLMLRRWAETSSKLIAEMPVEHIEEIRNLYLYLKLKASGT